MPTSSPFRPRGLLAASAVLLGLAMVPAAAHAAGVIRGTLTAPMMADSLRPAADPHPTGAGSLPGAAPPPRGRVVDAVVYAELQPAFARQISPDEMPRRERIVAFEQNFVPRVVAVPVGSAVQFPNDDRILHRIMSLSGPRRFDLGRYPEGESREVRFDKPGLASVFCDLHPNMEAWVLVLPHHVFARPDGRGRFELPALPAGTYTIKVWHPDFGTSVRDVELPPAGDIEVTLSCVP